MGKSVFFSNSLWLVVFAYNLEKSTSTFQCSSLDTSNNRFFLPDLGGQDNVFRYTWVQSGAGVSYIYRVNADTVSCTGTITAVEFCYIESFMTQPRPVFTLLTLTESNGRFTVSRSIEVFRNTSTENCRSGRITPRCCDVMPLKQQDQFNLPASNFIFGLTTDSTSLQTASNFIQGYSVPTCVVPALRSVGSSRDACILANNQPLRLVWFHITPILATSSTEVSNTAPTFASTSTDVSNTGPVIATSSTDVFNFQSTSATTIDATMDFDDALLPSNTAPELLDMSTSEARNATSSFNVSTQYSTTPLPPGASTKYTAFIPSPADDNKLNTLAIIIVVSFLGLVSIIIIIVLFILVILFLRRNAFNSRHTSSNHDRRILATEEKQCHDLILTEMNEAYYATLVKPEDAIQMKSNVSYKAPVFTHPNVAYNSII